MPEVMAIDKKRIEIKVQTFIDELGRKVAMLSIERATTMIDSRSMIMLSVKEFTTR